jgi:CBS domain-containing protein
MLANLTVADYMAKHIVTLSIDTEVLEAIGKLIKHKITSAPVIDEQGILVGMFSERNGINVVLKTSYNQTMGGKVSEFMSTEFVRIDGESSILDVAAKFEGTSIRSFPVFDGIDLVGVISRIDVLRALLSVK